MVNVTLGKSGDDELINDIRRMKAANGDFPTLADIVRTALVRYKQAICPECGDDRMQYLSSCICKKEEVI